MTGVTYTVHLAGGQESGVTSTAENSAAKVHDRTLAADRVIDRGLAGGHVDPRGLGVEGHVDRSSFDRQRRTSELAGSSVVSCFELEILV